MGDGSDRGVTVVLFGQAFGDRGQHLSTRRWVVRVVGERNGGSVSVALIVVSAEPGERQASVLSNNILASAVGFVQTLVVCRSCILLNNLVQVAHDFLSFG